MILSQSNEIWKSNDSSLILDISKTDTVERSKHLPSHLFKKFSQEYTSGRINSSVDGRDPKQGGKLQFSL